MPVGMKLTALHGEYRPLCADTGFGTASGRCEGSRYSRCAGRRDRLASASRSTEDLETKVGASTSVTAIMFLITGSSLLEAVAGSLSSSSSCALVREEDHHLETLREGRVARFESFVGVAGREE